MRSAAFVERFEFVFGVKFFQRSVFVERIQQSEQFAIVVIEWGKFVEPIRIVLVQSIGIQPKQPVFVGCFEFRNHGHRWGLRLL